MSKKKYGLIMTVCFLLLTLSGCNSWNVALMNVSNQESGQVSRSSYYWSGNSKRSMTIDEDDPKVLTFDVDMTKGSVTFVVENSGGEEVYTLTKEGEYVGTSQFEAPEAGTYTITEKGRSFSGSYKIIKGAAEEETESSEALETIPE